jgi:hypothetical protein
MQRFQHSPLFKCFFLKPRFRGQRNSKRQTVINSDIQTYFSVIDPWIFIWPFYI